MPYSSVPMWMRCTSMSACHSLSWYSYPSNSPTTNNINIGHFVPGICQSPRPLDEHHRRSVERAMPCIPRVRLATYWSPQRPSPSRRCRGSSDQSNFASCNPISKTGDQNAGHFGRYRGRFQPSHCHWDCNCGNWPKWFPHTRNMICPFESHWNMVPM